MNVLQWHVDDCRDCSLIIVSGLVREKPSLVSIFWNPPGYLSNVVVKKDNDLMVDKFGHPSNAVSEIAARLSGKCTKVSEEQL